MSTESAEGKPMVQNLRCYSVIVQGSHPAYWATFPEAAVILAGYFLIGMVASAVVFGRREFT